MIYKLQRRFILICTISVFTVITLVLGVIIALNISSVNRNMDVLADRVSEGGGKFPGPMENGSYHDKKPPKGENETGFITPETPFATRHFTVFFDNQGAVIKTNTESIYSIGEESAISFAEKAIQSDNVRGWLSHYRYKVFPTAAGTGVVFVDGSMHRSTLIQSTTIAVFVLLGCAALVLLLIILLSKKAVKPIAESYEKQKQFITNANHELKTPLTLILTNLDIAESELGKNEWLDDIRSEGHRMAELVGQLVDLSRMDEGESAISFSQVALDKIVSDTVLEFEPLANARGKSLCVSIEEGIKCRGDEAMLRRLTAILMDNAIKYCDDGGEIRLDLHRGKRVILTVENSYATVNETELNRLFDRFYRADKARSFGGGYGIGLSMAKAIVEKHRGDITAYKKDDTHIGFRVVLNKI